MGKNLRCSFNRLPPVRASTETSNSGRDCRSALNVFRTAALSSVMRIRILVILILAPNLPPFSTDAVGSLFGFIYTLRHCLLSVVQEREFLQAGRVSQLRWDRSPPPVAGVTSTCVAIVRNLPAEGYVFRKRARREIISSIRVAQRTTVFEASASSSGVPPSCRRASNF